MSFVQTRIQKVIAGLQSPLTSDMAIYKLYNDGFIVRTQSATVAFDMVMGSTYQLIPDSLMSQLVDKCDVLFLSHKHRDHVDPGVVAMFTERGKQVVAPAEALPVCLRQLCVSRCCLVIKTSCRIISTLSPLPRALLLYRRATSTLKKIFHGLSSCLRLSPRLMCC